METKHIWIVMLIAGIALGVLMTRIYDNYTAAGKCKAEGKILIPNGQCIAADSLQYCQNNDNQIFARQVSMTGDYNVAANLS